MFDVAREGVDHLVVIPGEQFVNGSLQTFILIGDNHLIAKLLDLSRL